MPRSRNSQVSLIDTPYYHCVTRCVRRSFICGAVFMWGGSRAVDKYLGQNYEHRRGGVENRLLFLAGIFAIDSAATVFVLTTGCVCMTSVG
jgi:hypothetical protein